jgi:hypothetical protein
MSEQKTVEAKCKCLFPGSDMDSALRYDCVYCFTCIQSTHIRSIYNRTGVVYVDIESIGYMDSIDIFKYLLTSTIGNYVFTAEVKWATSCLLCGIKDNLLEVVRGSLPRGSSRILKYITNEMNELDERITHMIVDNNRFSLFKIVLGAGCRVSDRTKKLIIEEKERKYLHYLLYMGYDCGSNDDSDIKPIIDRHKKQRLKELMKNTSVAKKFSTSINDYADTIIKIVIDYTFFILTNTYKMCSDRS